MENKQDERKSGIRGMVDGIPKRSCMVMCLAGAYIMYLGFQLCKNVMDGVDGGGIGFLIAGIVFLVLGALFLAVSIRGFVLESKKQAEETEDASIEESSEEETEEKETEETETEEAEQAEGEEDACGQSDDNTKIQ